MILISQMRLFFSRHFHLVFIGFFIFLTGYLAFFSPLWADENVYLEMAQRASSNPFDLFEFTPSWIPHPPLGWYLFALFSFMPRIASVLVSAFCAFLSYYLVVRLCGKHVAEIFEVCLLSSWGFMLYSAVAHLDGLLTAFMTISVLSFLGWTRLGDRKFLLLSMMSLTLASLTKYTATPILLGTFGIWLVLERKNLKSSAPLAVASIMISLVPLFLWVYGITSVYQDLLHEYSEIYGLFLFDAFLIGKNILAYTLALFSLWGLPFLSWLRKRTFDSEARMVLVYAAIVYFLFVLISPNNALIYQSEYRYLLPVVPATALLSAKSLVQEKPHLRYAIVAMQFCLISVITFRSLSL